MINKSAVLVANGKLEVQNAPMPKLEAGHARVRIKNAGVCSSDIQRGFGGGAYFYPLVMGHELAGEVVESACSFKAGERVVIFPLLPCFACEACTRESYAQCHKYSYYGSRCAGGYAEYLDVKEWNLLKVPDGVALEDAAATEPLAVVIHAMKRLKIAHKDASIAVIGAGFLGLLLADVIKHEMPGVKLTLMDRNAFKLELAAKAGAHTLHLSNDAAWAEYEKTAPVFDYVVEASGVPACFARSVVLAKHGGTVLWMGNITGDLTLPAKLVSSILRKELDVLGTWNSSYKTKTGDDWQEALNLMAKGLKPSRYVTHRVGLEGLSGMLSNLYAHKNGGARFDAIKVMVEP